MTDLSDRDRRQLALIAERLDGFAKGDISLRVLIADLEFLLDQLPEETRRGLHPHWEALEEAYAVFSAARRGEVDEAGKKLVRDSVSALEAKVRSLLLTSTE